MLVEGILSLYPDFTTLIYYKFPRELITHVLRKAIDMVF